MGFQTNLVRENRRPPPPPVKRQRRQYPRTVAWLKKLAVPPERWLECVVLFGLPPEDG